jgi:hypothetical protein
MPYDLWLAGLAGLAVALFQLGYPEQAVVRCRKAPDAAERLRDPADLAYNLYHACMLDQLCRDVPGLERRASRLHTLAAEQGFAHGGGKLCL